MITASPLRAQKHFPFSRAVMTALIALSALLAFSPGAAAQSTELTVENRTETGATLTLTGHTGWWHYKRLSPAPHSLCFPVTDGMNANIQQQLQLAPNTSYTFGAYNGFSCAPENKLAEATFKTLDFDLAGKTNTTATLRLRNYPSGQQWWYRKTHPYEVSCTSVTETETTVTSLTKNTSYSFKAYRAATCENDDWIGDLHMKTLPAHALFADNVKKTTATLRLTNANIDWWYKKTSGPGAATCMEVNQGTTTVDLTGLTKNTSYTYTAYRHSSCSEAQKIDHIDFVTLPDVPAAPPGKPAVTGGDRQVTLTASISNNGGSAVTGWEYQQKEDGGSYGSWAQISSSSSGNSLSGTVTGLQNGTAYRFKVRAVNRGGSGAESPESDSVTPRASGPIGLTLSSNSVAESASATAITVTAAIGNNSNPFTTDRAITVAVGGGTATEGTDYPTVNDFTITLSAGSTSAAGTFSIDPTEDTLDEGSGETVTVSGSSMGLTVNSATLTITDNDATPGSIGLTLSDSSVDEGDAATTITVTATVSGNTRFAADKAITVAVGASGDTATEGTDYSTVNDFTITLSAGSASVTGTFSVDPTQDTLDEGADESVSVTGSTSDSHSVTAASFKINDDDATPGSIGLTLSDSSVDEGDAATTITVTATVSGSTRFAADKAITVAVGASGDMAAEGTDYSTVNDFTITLSAGSASVTGTFSVNPTQDTLDEGTDESVSVTGSTSDSHSVTAASFKINDDDATPGSIGLTLSDSSVDEGDAATTITVTATVSGNTRFAADKAITVAVGASGDTAAEGTDYSTVNDFTITLSAGSASVTGTFSVNPTQDTLDEGTDESVSVTGSTSDSHSVTAASFKINDDDATPGSIGLTLSDSSVDEGDAATTITVTATVSGSTRFAADKAITVAVGASGDTAAEGTDYSTVNDFTITLSAGSASVTGTFSVDPTQDTLDEGTDESVSVTGSTSDSHSVTAASFKINDDDATPGSIGLTLSDSSVDEGDAATTITVTATVSGNTRFAADKAITVAVGASGDTAAEGTDYSTVNDFTITLSAGSASVTGTFSVNPTQDTIDEGADESVTVSGTSTGLTINPATLKITDDDDAAISLNLSDLSVAEDESAKTVTVTATISGSTRFSTDKVITVAVGATGDTATEGTDYSTVNDFTITITAGSASTTGTFSFEPKDDDVYEGDEKVTVSGTTADDHTVTAAKLTLAEDELVASALTGSTPSSSSITVSDVRTSEGARRAGFTVSLSAESASAVTVNYETSGGTATPGSDYEAVSGGLTFAPGETGKTIFFAVADDDLDEEDETFTVTLSDPVNATLEVAVATALIADDDDEPNLSMADITVAENAGTAELTASLGGPSGKTVSVDYATSDGTAVSGSDYEAVSGSLTFAPGETEKTISVRVTDDIEVESDESFTVRLSGQSNVSLSGASVSVTIEDDDRRKFAERLKDVSNAILPEISRAMAASSVGAVASRVGQSVSGNVQNAFGASGHIPRRHSVLDGNRRFYDNWPETGEQYEDPYSWRETLGESFTFLLAGGYDHGLSKESPVPESPEIPAGPGNFGVWIAGDYMSLSDSSDKLIDWDGRLLSGHLGADVRLGENLLAGVMVSRLHGKFDYTDVGDGSHKVGGRYTSLMNSIHPYLGWSSSREGSGMWVTAGYGFGDVEIDDRNMGRRSSSDARLWTLASGGSLRLLARGFSVLDLKGEAWVSSLKVEDNEDTVRGLEVRTNRVKVAVSGSRSLSLGSGVLTPSLELGLRRDGGDGNNGLDSEVGGGLSYVSAAMGLTVEASGRRLLFSRGRGLRAWGIGGSVQYDRGADGRGFSFSILPSYGETASGIDRLWEDRMADIGFEGGPEPRMSVSSEVGYGLAAFGGRGLLKPYGSFAVYESDRRTYGLGSRMETGRELILGLEGRRLEGGDAGSGHELVLRGSVNW